MRGQSDEIRWQSAGASNDRLDSRTLGMLRLDSDTFRAQRVGDVFEIGHRLVFCTLHGVLDERRVKRNATNRGLDECCYLGQRHDRLHQDERRMEFLRQYRDVRQHLFGHCRSIQGDNYPVVHQWSLGVRFSGTVRAIVATRMTSDQRSPTTDHRQRSEPRQAPPVAMVIFGTSGAQRKLVPALFDLFGDKLLLRNFAVLGFGRTPLADDDFRNLMRDGVERFSRHAPVSNRE